MEKVIDASSLFFDEGEVALLLEEVQCFDLHSPQSLSSMIARINQIDPANLTSDGVKAFRSLCGRAHQLSVNNMIDTIYEESVALSEESSLSSEEVQKRMKVLQAMMAHAQMNHSLSEENRTFLRMAVANLSSLKKANVIHRCKNTEEEEMLPESTVKGTQVNPKGWADAELAIDLLEVAQLLHEGREDEGIAKFHLLPEDVQEELATLDVEAMVALAYKIGRGDGYVPSKEEIQQMFAEAPPCA